MVFPSLLSLGKRAPPNTETFMYTHTTNLAKKTSGMTPNIRGVLSTLLPGPDAEEIDIIANDVKFTDPEGKGNTWEIVFRHPTSGFGHDKSQAILPYRDLPHKPTLFFCGDGVSDLSAAKHADLLFAKTMVNGHSDLQTYCEKQGIRHVPFVDLYVCIPHPLSFFL